MRSLIRGNGFWLVVCLMMVLIALYAYQPGARRSEAIEFSAFMDKVENQEVKQVTIQGQAISGVYTNDLPFHTTGPETVEPVYNSLVEHGVTPNFEKKGDQVFWSGLLLTLIPVALLGVIAFWVFRNIQGTNGRAMSFGKSRARLHTDQQKRVTFQDVAGIDEVKEELEEIIDFLKDPGKFTRLGGRIPKGVLLMGPPGTGKTLLARAVAGEAGVPFFSISGSDFVEMFVGVGASRVRDLFENARKNAPCIIFIDEIDAVGRHRGNGMGGGHDEREQTLNQLLVEMDGFEGTEGVILIAATNRADVLDSALLRPGRFDRRIIVPSPDVTGRAHVLAIHTRNLPLADDVDLAVVARGTPGFSGADLENLSNEAALLAARQNKKRVEMVDFLAAREKIVMGPERRSMFVGDHEKKNTAYHEAGHAIIAFLMPGHDPVQKVTIVPRGRALGLTWTLPHEDRLSMNRLDLLRRITMMMGGRAAEEVAMNEVTGGAANDIQQATRLARHMVCNLGMSEELGPVHVDDEAGDPFSRGRGVSENTLQRVDQEVRGVLSRAYDSARTILRTNVHVLDIVAQRLIEKESLDADEFAELVREAGPVTPTGMPWMGLA